MKNFKFIFSLLFLLSTVSFAGSFTYEASENDVGVYVQNDNSLELEKIAHVDLVKLTVDSYSQEYDFEVVKIVKNKSYSVAILTKSKNSNCQNLYVTKLLPLKTLYNTKRITHTYILNQKLILGSSSGGLSRNCILS